MDEQQGPFDRILRSEPAQYRDRAATAIVIAGVFLGLLLLLLVLPPISIFDDGGDDGPVDLGPVTATLRDQIPAPPPGFEAVSGLLDLESAEPVSQPARLTLDLTSTVAEDTELALFTYDGESWRRLGDAVAIGDDAAQGEVLSLPANVAVFRPVEQSSLVIGSLPAGAELDGEAASALTVLTPRGFRPEADGTVSGDTSGLPDGGGLDIVPTISATSAPARDALNTILASEELRAAHAEAILDFVRENELDGIDFDYRSLEPGQSEAFVALLRELSDGLRADGRTLSLTLPIPVQGTDGWDTRGFDWEELAPLATFVRLLPEADQSIYFERMEAALGYLVPRAGSSKLVLTVSRVSRERTADGIDALTATEALGLASAPAVGSDGAIAPGVAVQLVGENLGAGGETAGPQWDDTARAVVFQYTGAGGARTVWLANVFSEAFKLELARRYQLGGIAIDDVSEDTADVDLRALVAAYVEGGALELAKPNGDLLQPRWVASGGTLESDVGPAVTWRAPEEAGSYTLTLVVSDGVLRVGRELELSVAAGEGARAP